MDLTTINGLPAHVLLVHAVVVLVPLAALLVVASAAWPAARRRLGVATPIVAFVALVFVPVTTDAGEWLERHVDEDPLVRVHTEMGDELLPWVIGLFAVALAVWGIPVWLRRRQQEDGVNWLRPLGIALAALAVVGAVGAIVQVYRIGDSGAKAVWHDGFNSGDSAEPGH